MTMTAGRGAAGLGAAFEASRRSGGGCVVARVVPRKWLPWSAFGDTIALGGLTTDRDGDDPEPHPVTDRPGDADSDYAFAGLDVAEPGPVTDAPENPDSGPPDGD